MEGQELSVLPITGDFSRQSRVMWTAWIGPDGKQGCRKFSPRVVIMDAGAPTYCQSAWAIRGQKKAWLDPAHLNK